MFSVHGRFRSCKPDAARFPSLQYTMYPCGLMTALEYSHTVYRVSGVLDMVGGIWHLLLVRSQPAPSRIVLTMS